MGNESVAPEDSTREPLLATLHNGDVRSADLFLVELCMAFVFYNRSGARKNDHPLLSYAWYHWDEHLKSETQKPEEREQNYFRTQAASILDRLMTDYKQRMYWLPAEGERELLDALDVPYFYPNFEKFRISSHSTNTASTEDTITRISAPTSENDVRGLPSDFYQPLDPGRVETRLVEILPGLSEVAVTECQLSVFPIEAAPVFDAISYA